VPHAAARHRSHSRTPRRAAPLRSTTRRAVVACRRCASSRPPATAARGGSAVRIAQCWRGRRRRAVRRRAAGLQQPCTCAHACAAVATLPPAGQARAPLRALACGSTRSPTAHTCHRRHRSAQPRLMMCAGLTRTVQPDAPGALWRAQSLSLQLTRSPPPRAPQPPAEAAHIEHVPHGGVRSRAAAAATGVAPLRPPLPASSPQPPAAPLRTSAPSVPLPSRLPCGFPATSPPPTPPVTAVTGMLQTASWQHSPWLPAHVARSFRWEKRTPALPWPARVASSR
jgi:hypothetical protein